MGRRFFETLNSTIEIPFNNDCFAIYVVSEADKGSGSVKTQIVIWEYSIGERSLARME